MGAIADRPPFATAPVPGLIPQSFIQDLLARVDIVEVIGARVELKRAGRELKGLSPFTNEKTPSFHVSPAKQMFFDFSSGKNGNAIGFLMEHDRLSFVEAVEELAGQLGLEVPREGGHHERLVLEGPLDAMAAAQRFFSEQLRKHKPAVGYLKQRGVSGETAKTFGIGFAPDSWDALSKFFDDPRHAIDAGLLRQKEGSDRVFDVFRNRITFPIRDTRGRVIGFGGRTLGDDPAKYLNSPETVLFHKGRNLFGLYEAKQSLKSALPQLIVVEGYMDVVMLAQYGIHEAVATLGTATTADQLRLMFKSTQKVVFCFDGDRAGRSAAWRALEQALPEVDERRECHFMFLPDGHDPDSLVQEIGAEAFRERLAESQTLSTFLLEGIARQSPPETLEGRARFAGLARPYLEKMQPGPLRSLLTDEVARISRLRREEFGVVPEQQSPQVRPPRFEAGEVRPVKRALKYLLEMPGLAQTTDALDRLLESDAPGVEFLVSALAYFQEHPDSSVARLLAHLEDEPRKREALTRVLNTDVDDPAYGPGLRDRADESLLRQEFSETIAHICTLPLRRRYLQLMDESSQRDLSVQEMREMAELQKQLRNT